MRTLLTSRACRLATAASAVVLGVLLAQTATAQQCGEKPAACAGCADQCGRCGHRGPCQLGCQVVCEMKEEKKVVWVVKCEGMCTTLPGCPLGQCDCGQDGCGDCAAGCGKGGASCAKNCGDCLVPPKCGRERCIKKLEKKEIVCQKRRTQCCWNSWPAAGGSRPCTADCPEAPDAASTTSG
jgi:hypothetical protein